MMEKRMKALRTPEKLLIAYFVYTAVLALILPLKPAVRGATLAVNALVISGYFLLAWADSQRRREFLGIVRDWYPLPQMLLAYREMGWFAQPHADFHLERAWVAIDKLLLNGWGIKAAIESTGPILPAVLEISYTLVYTIATFGMAMLYVYRRRERVPAFQTVFLLGILSAYALFPYFPSEPPRTVFPGEDFPAYMSAFRRFNWKMLGGYGIHTSVFPSAHVSGAFAGAFAMILLLPEQKWVGRTLTVLAVLIAIATVYGRYHYAVDAIAGFSIAVIAAVAARKFFRV
jgi:membrane-associated phospholipid phosphatase